MLIPSNSDIQSSDLIKNSARLIRLRWLAGFLLLALTPLLRVVLGIQLPVPAVYILAGSILAYNGLLWWILHLPDSRRPYRLASLQVALDLVAMTILLHLTGGVESLAMNFFMFYVLLAPLLLAERGAVIFVAVMIAAVAGTVGLEALQVIPHYSVRPALPTTVYRDPLYIAGKLIFFSAITAVLTGLTIPIIRDFRERERHVTTLYLNIQALSRSLDLPRVLDQLAQSATRALAARGALIRLVDDSGNPRSLAASYGLSKTFANRVPVQAVLDSIDRLSAINQVVVINNLELDSRLDNPSPLIDEGIRSLACAPLTGRRGLLGKLHIYGGRRDFFGPAEIEFVTAIASQGATAIENGLAYAELQRTDQTKSQFVRAVTHELRSPVVGAQSLLRSVMHTASELTDLQRSILTRLSARLDMLQMLIDDLLDLAAGKFVGQDLEVEVVSLEAAVLDVIDQFANPAQEKNIDLHMNYVPRGLNVLANRDGLARIFLNLIGNAIKYTPDGGKVSVTLERQADEAVIAVSDTGIGIPDHALPHLFEEFFRAPNAKEASIPGTGLGLAIVKDLITCYHGRITVQSEVGAGTTFTVTLPLVSS